MSKIKYALLDKRLSFAVTFLFLIATAIVALTVEDYLRAASATEPPRFSINSGGTLDSNSERFVVQGSIGQVGTGRPADGDRFSLTSGFWSVTATLTVNSTNDLDDGFCGSNHCSLREAIRAANRSPGLDTIKFAITGNGPHRLSPTSALPSITDPVFIDGYSQPGAVPATTGTSAVLMIELDGSQAGSGANGLSIFSSDVTVQGLAINRFNPAGILVQDSRSNVIRGNYIGTDTTGVTGLGNIGPGIRLSGAIKSLVGGDAPEDLNLISSNGNNGIQITDLSGPEDGSDENRIIGNFIGTDIDGSAAIPNLQHGISINRHSDANTVARNLISGNEKVGVQVSLSSSANTITENRIGTDTDGAAALPNGTYGVQANDVHGTIIGPDNVISGNGQSGVYVLNLGSTGTKVAGNFIGTDHTGLNPIGNGQFGVLVELATDITIGGPLDADRNVIGDSNFSGVNLARTTESAIENNYIGLGDDGLTPIGNRGGGVGLDRADDNTITGNVISSSGTQLKPASGLTLTDQTWVPDDPTPGIGANRNLIVDNKIGTDFSGKLARGNWGIGIDISAGSKENSVLENTISDNHNDGITIRHLGTGENIVQDNKIGTDVDGISPLGNHNIAVFIVDSGHNTIGGPEEAGNVISGNDFDGIRIQGDKAQYNVVAGNKIGTDVSGTEALGNGALAVSDGIRVFNSSWNEIGPDNVISGNSGNGVSLVLGSAHHNSIFGNEIGTDFEGEEPIPNGRSGVTLDGDTDDRPGINIIGGRWVENEGVFSIQHDGNTISGNALSGILIQHSDSNSIYGNKIGTDKDGDRAVGNGGGGIVIDRSSGNTVGDLQGPLSNVISGNLSGPGVIITDTQGTMLGGSGNSIQGNLIGTDGTGSFAIANSGPGIEISGGAKGNRVGRGLASLNVISGNGLDGILLRQPAIVDDSVPDEGDRNRFEGNHIGVNLDGTMPIPNQNIGIFVLSNQNSFIDNVISGHAADNVRIQGEDAHGNRFRGNKIGTNASGAGQLVDLNNQPIQGGADNGIKISSARDNTVGPDNVIGNNAARGVVVALAGSTGNSIFGNHIGTDSSSTINLGNASGGVVIEDAPANRIGDASIADGGNVIAFNGGAGITIIKSGATGNEVVRNVFFENAGIALDLTGDGPSENDDFDLDTGPNGVQNYPEIQSAVVNQISGTVRTPLAVSGTLRVDLYATGSFDDAPSNSVLEFIGSANAVLQAGGESPFTVIPNRPLQGGEMIRAQATHFDAGAGNSSEFGPATEVLYINPDVALNYENLNLGTGLSTDLHLTVSDEIQGGIDLRITQSDPSALALILEGTVEAEVTDLLVFGENTTLASLRMDGLDDVAGVVLIEFDGRGLRMKTLAVDIAQPEFGFRFTRIGTGSGLRTGRTQSDGTFLPQRTTPTGPAITATLSTENPEISLLRDSDGSDVLSIDLDIAPGTIETPFDAVSQDRGVATIRAEAVGLALGTGLFSSLGVINLSADLNVIGRGLQQHLTATFSSPPGETTTVDIRTLDADRLLVAGAFRSASTTGWSILGATGTQVGFDALALENVPLGPVSVEVTAEGYIPATYEFDIWETEIRITGLPLYLPSTNRTRAFYVQFGPVNEQGQLLQYQRIRLGAEDRVVNLESSDPSTAGFKDSSGAIHPTESNLVVEESLFVNLTLDLVSAGNFTLSATMPDFGTAELQRSVIAPPVTMPAEFLLGAGLTREVIANLEGPHEGAMLRLSSTNGDLTFSRSSGIAGVPVLTIDLSSGVTSAEFWVHARQGVTAQDSIIAQVIEGPVFETGMANVNIVEPRLHIPWVTSATGETLAGIVGSFNILTGIYGSGSEFVDQPASPGSDYDIVVTYSSNAVLRSLVTGEVHESPAVFEVAGPGLNISSALSLTPLTATQYSLQAEYVGIPGSANNWVAIGSLLPPIEAEDTSLKVGNNLQTKSFASVPGSIHERAVTITSADESLVGVSLNPDQMPEKSINIVLPQGETEIEFYVHAYGQLAETFVSVGSPLAAPARIDVEVVRGRVELMTNGLRPRYTDYYYGFPSPHGPLTYEVATGIGNHPDFVEQPLSPNVPPGFEISVSVDDPVEGLIRDLSSTEIGATLSLEIDAGESRSGRIEFVPGSLSSYTALLIAQGISIVPPYNYQINVLSADTRPIEVRNQHTENDGIASNIDGFIGPDGLFIDESNTRTGYFTDEHLGGITSGVIWDGGTYFVRDATMPDDPEDGIFIATYFYPLRGDLFCEGGEVVPFTVTGSSYLTCTNSVRVVTVSGETIISTSTDTEITIGSDVSAIVAETDGEISVENDPSSGGTVLIESAGETIELNPGQIAVKEIPNSSPNIVDVAVSETNTPVGGQVEVSITVVDHDAGQEIDLVVDWGDGTTTQFINPAGELFTEIAAHSYAASGEYQILVSASDGEVTQFKEALEKVTVVGGSSTTLSLVTGSAQEGEVVVLQGTLHDLTSAQDSISVSISWGDGTEENRLLDAGQADFQASHVYEDNGNYRVVATAELPGPELITATAIAVVTNKDPQVLAVCPDSPQSVSSPVQCAVEIIDADQDTHTAMIDWGDGTIEAVFEAEGQFIPQHTYATPGIYLPVITVADDDGGEATTTSDFLVMFDPLGGFATGGGWFIPGKVNNSDLDDLLPGIDGESKANFGFVVKYQNGNSTTPAGQLEFHYNAGDFKLHSLAYEWLVLTNNSWAKFQGTATIEGLEGEFPFKVEARDGNNSQPDRFVITIWAPGDDPDLHGRLYKASGDLGGGNIKIHE